jgi:D-mannonate dehydratase
MDKIENFKSFVKTKPFLAYKVHSGLTSWQKLYEIYDVYGESHEIFTNGEKQKETTNTEKQAEQPTASNTNYKAGISSVLKAVQDIDIDKLSDNLNSFKKIFSLFGTTKATTVENSGKTYKRFED